jgi:large subunit ribosomal protein L9
MELILKETIDTLGEEGDLVKVKPGYARNYLIPRNKAVIANKANIAIHEREKATIDARKETQRKDFVNLANKINGTVVTIAQRVGEENRLFGSVTAADIFAKLFELGIKVDKKRILLDEPIKTLGETLVQIKVGYQVNAEVKVKIVPLESE